MSVIETLGIAETSNDDIKIQPSDFNSGKFVDMTTVNSLLSQEQGAMRGVNAANGNRFGTLNKTEGYPTNLELQDVSDKLIGKISEHTRHALAFIACTVDAETNEKTYLLLANRSDESVNTDESNDSYTGEILFEGQADALSASQGRAAGKDFKVGEFGTSTVQSFENKGMSYEDNRLAATENGDSKNEIAKMRTVEIRIGNDDFNTIKNGEKSPNILAITEGDLKRALEENPTSFTGKVHALFQDKVPIRVAA